MNVVKVGYGSTNYYVLAGDPEAMLLIDCGWPGTMGRLKRRLQEKGIELGHIRYLLVTHYHPDHAGLVQELRNAGLKLIMMETQVPFVEPLKRIMKPDSGYVEIVIAGTPVVRFADSRALLKGVGIDGEIIPTPGHSPDSVTLVLDDGIAFTGDLTPESMIAEDDVVAGESWRQIYGRGVRTIYPAHGPIREIFRGHPNHFP
jgi:glyoxylase-like metal-dependent hydrolase (beta-lactamase superfamily II)